MWVDTYVESQPVRGSGEGNLGALREVEDIAGLGGDLLTGLVRDLEFALQDNLHLVVRVLVDQRGTLLETVETARDRLLGVIRLTIFPSGLSNRSNGYATLQRLTWSRHLREKHSRWRSMAA